MGNIPWKQDQVSGLHQLRLIALEVHPGAAFIDKVERNLTGARDVDCPIAAGLPMVEDAGIEADPGQKMRQGIFLNVVCWAVHMRTERNSCDELSNLNQWTWIVHSSEPKIPI